MTNFFKKNIYLRSVIYPNNFEQKIGFCDIRSMLKNYCLSTLGKEKVDEITFSTDADVVNRWLNEVREFRRLQEEKDNFPMQYFFDVRESISRIRLEGTHLEENEVWDLRRSLETIANIVQYLNNAEDGGVDSTDTVKHKYPALQKLTENVQTFPAMIRRIDSILDKFGKIKDSASMTLAGIRHELHKMEGSISRTLYTILHAAQKEGIVDKDVTPALRDGRLVIPVQPSMKRKISGIVHDESATGRTVFIEPTEVVEANNKVRELEAAERREVIRILTVFSDEVRPYVDEILNSYNFLALIDMIQAKAALAEKINAIEPFPQVLPTPHLDWIHAIHPLLQLSLEKQGKKVVPLDIMLKDPKTDTGERKEPCGRLLIISGPNAGGKSVCLKTVGLLQYMLQCGLSIPIGDHSTTGIFDSIMIDIGDEQSIENDLSTYSSHLLNMKQMMKQANGRTLLLIDEFGTGTEPQIGGAIAEAVLKQFWKKKTFAVITTHYQNLKHFAEDHEGVVNGAMLYDRQALEALFRLSIGQPGSSFAIEIARKTGLPEEVINDASEIVGREYIQSDKFLQDIVRDKRYWEGKRQAIHQHERGMQEVIQRYEQSVEEIQQERKQILHRAQQQAEELLSEANKKIENTIREIREQQAAKEETRHLREELNKFKEEVAEIDTLASDALIDKKMKQILARRERKAKRKEEKKNSATQKASTTQDTTTTAQHATRPTIPFKTGDAVRIKGMNSVGTIESLDGNTALIILGDMHTKLPVSRLEHAKAVVAQPKGKMEQRMEEAQRLSKETRATIDSHRKVFHPEIDLRGMRADEALQLVQRFIDDAILIGVHSVRILHGKGNGILRQLIRQYLATIPGVSHFADEHVQFGGAGITVVELI